MLNTLRKEPILDRITNGVAAGGLSSPVWWPHLETASNIAVLLVPILSALWLVVQIIGYIRRMRREALAHEQEHGE